MWTRLTLTSATLEAKKDYPCSYQNNCCLYGVGMQNRKLSIKLSWNPQGGHDSSFPATVLSDVGESVILTQWIRDPECTNRGEFKLTR